MNPIRWSFRLQCLLGAGICASFLGYALYVQHGMFMMPCPLCILQRIAFAAMGIFFVVGAIVGGRPGWARRISALLVALSAAAGAAIAVWHLRLQNLPPSEVPSCSGMDLGYMLDAFPLQTVIEKVFKGSGECAVVDWTFLGISMPGWTLIWYVLLGIAVLWAGFRRSSTSSR
jgi:protein dithiol:quinone oxidoreductase